LLLLNLVPLLLFAERKRVSNGTLSCLPGDRRVTWKTEVLNMISANNVTYRVGKKALFEDVNIKFTEGNCYGLIGANGAGKSTFLKILSGSLDTTNGDIAITPGQRLSVLEQDHFKYDAYPVMDVVIMGNERLYQIMKEKDAIYAKEDFSDEDGIRASELEAEFAEMDGWDAESNAAMLLNGLGIDTDLHYSMMSSLDGNAKVKVLLAKALFGNPDILLLDEPTNHLDLDAIAWLEEFLINFENTVIVVSHDRYFLNKVCTHTADIDYGKIQLYAGNYDFWYESSQLIIKQRKEANKKKEEQIKELQEFISRFSANASKSKQATSRKRALEKIELDDIKPSSRKYPYIDFRPEREIGNEVLTVEGISKTINGEKVLDNISFIVGHDDKIAFVGGNELAKTTLFKILTGEMEPDEGTYKWGVTTSQAYFPKDNTAEFDNDYTISDWLMGYSPVKDITYVRGFLGRMLFAGDDGVKKVKVLSGGEKVRCLLSKMMISGANCLIFDEPTNHLDMEAITALNEGMIKFKGVELFSCHDHQVVQTTANRIIEILPDGTIIDKITTYDEYLESDEMARKRTVYTSTATEEED
jgi:ATPase subunit of ABC transporter with duplicated ATPase domains